MFVRPIPPQAQRAPGRAGVWVHRDGLPDSKEAAVGVRIFRGVTMHGFALNVDCDLSWLDRIVRCGTSDASVTALATLTGRTSTVEAALERVERHLVDVAG